MWDNTYMKLINTKDTTVDKETENVYRDDEMRDFLGHITDLELLEKNNQLYIVVWTEPTRYSG